MAFWLTALLIFGIGLLVVHQNFTFNHYIDLLIIAPPTLTLIENLGVMGFDNLLLPPAVLLMLYSMQA
jgi:hypothetical protein